MELTVKCFATLSPLTPSPQPYPWDGGTVSDLMEHLNVPASEVKLIFVNGVIVEPTQPLADGDRVGLFPPVGGG